MLYVHAFHDFESLQRLFAKGNQNLFSISHWSSLVGIGDGTRRADRPQRVRLLIILRSRAVQPASCALAPETDIVGVVDEIRFVPILLQKSVEIDREA
jgi:hypothetical protein